jgi:hypothetical protein
MPGSGFKWMYGRMLMNPRFRATLLCVCYCQAIFYPACVQMLRTINEASPNADNYSALDTHSKGYHKCPVAKIDVSLSLSRQVSDLMSDLRGDATAAVCNCLCPLLRSHVTVSNVLQEAEMLTGKCQKC